MFLSGMNHDWIGEIPDHWEKQRIKNIFHLIKNPSDSPESENILSLTMNGIVKRDISSNEGQLPETYNGYTKILINDIVINPMDLKSGWVDKSGYSGIISPSYFVLNKNITKTSIGYFTYQLQRHYKEKIFFSFGQGVSYEYRWGLSRETLLNFPIVVPPFKEQQQISDYLDYKTSKIDTFIEKTQQKIELLKEQRTSLINTTVTKGLNPDVEMKDSGVEWIGEIPSGWSVVKLKFVGDVVIGLSYSPDDVVEEGEGTLVMRSSNVQNGKPSFEDNVFVNKEIPDKLITKEGDILICSRNGSRNLIGKNCVIHKDIEGMTFGVFMTIFRSKYWRFVYWVLNSPVFKSQSGLYLTSTINQLTVSTIQNLTVPFTFDKNEQQQIVDYLDREISKIDKLIDVESRRIDLLKEYRQSLISGVVTGKVDVRDEVIV